ncbi:MAG: TIGR00341 family protein [Candidatus Hodarchaeales archaeon]
MKQIQVTVPAGQGWIIKERLEKEKFRYISLIDGRTGDLLFITVDSKMVEKVLSVLIDEGVSRKHGVIHVLDATARLPVLAMKASKDRGVSKEEIFEDMRSRASLDRSFIAYIFLSAVIAAVGVIADNVVILIASMIVAPLMAPMVALSFSILMNNNKIFWSAIKTQAIGLAVSVMIGIMIGVAVSPTSANDAMFRTSTISLFDLIVAVVGGLAAGVATTERKQSEIVGIAVAASLMPPATNVGIQLWMTAFVSSDIHWPIALGSIFLLSTNVIAIHLSCLVVYWFQKIRPRTEWATKLSKGTVRRRIAVMAILSLSALTPILTVSLTTYSDWNIQTNSVGIIEYVFGSELDIIVTHEQITIQTSSDDPSLLVITIQAIGHNFTNDTTIVSSLSNIKSEIEDLLANNIFSAFQSWKKVDIILYLISSSSYRV